MCMTHKKIQKYYISSLIAIIEPHNPCLELQMFRYKQLITQSDVTGSKKRKKIQIKIFYFLNETLNLKFG